MIYFNLELEIFSVLHSLQVLDWWDHLLNVDYFLSRITFWSNNVIKVFNPEYKILKNRF
jgi:hypothetical protein